MSKAIKQSETREIRRSQINLNPINPKRHSDEKVKLQKKNLQKVGYCGGVVWNERSGNLIDGHRRIKAMDILYGYDGTPQTDYTIKVEVVDFDEKTEKEQLTYMAVGNTKYDIDLIAEYVTEIDIENVGLSESEMSDILAMTSSVEVEIDSPFDDLLSAPQKKEEEDTKSYEDKKQHMKDVKQQVKEAAEQRALNENSYITLSFSSFSAFQDFCELMGIRTNERYAKGEDVLSLIQ